MKVYISGKITGLDLDQARAKFEADEAMLRRQGHEVTNPMKITGNDDESWHECMSDCLDALLYCDAIFMQPDWGTSTGARIEYATARELGLQVMFGSVVNEEN